MEIRLFFGFHFTCGTKRGFSRQGRSPKMTDNSVAFRCMFILAVHIHSVIISSIHFLEKKHKKPLISRCDIDCFPVTSPWKTPSFDTQHCFAIWWTARGRLSSTVFWLFMLRPLVTGQELSVNEWRLFNQKPTWVNTYCMWISKTYFGLCFMDKSAKRNSLASIGFNGFDLNHHKF